MALSVKLSFKGDARRFGLDLATAPSFVALIAQIRKTLLLNEEEFESLVVKYLDDEDDLITITSDAELNEAVAVSLRSDDPVLHLRLLPNNGVTQGQPEESDEDEEGESPFVAVHVPWLGRVYLVRRSDPVQDDSDEEEETGSGCRCHLEQDGKDVFERCVDDDDEEDEENDEDEEEDEAQQDSADGRRSPQLASSFFGNDTARAAPTTSSVLPSILAEAGLPAALQHSLTQVAGPFLAVFDENLHRLTAMGFTDSRANLAALALNRNNLLAAVDRLVA